jgi:hypothetical protein
LGCRANRQAWPTADLRRYRRNARKHGGTKRRVWRKIHIGIDEKTLEIRAAEFTTSDVGDAPILPELLDQIPPEQEIASGCWQTNSNQPQLGQ